MGDSEMLVSYRWQHKRIDRLILVAIDNLCIQRYNTHY